MPKKLLLLALLTAVIIIFTSQAKMLIHYYDNIVVFVEFQLSYLFKPTGLGPIIRKALALLLTPVLIIMIPAIGYWIIKNKQLPYLYHALWIIWLITITKLSIS